MTVDRSVINGLSIFILHKIKLIISNVYVKFWEAYSVVIKAFVVFNKLKFSSETINLKETNKQKTTTKTKKPNKQNFTLPGLLIVPQTI